MKHPQQQRAWETRDRILDMAELLFDERGYRKTSMNALAERADLSVGGLYEWFKNKDEVLTAVAERHVEEVGARILERLGESRHLDLKLRMQIVLEEGLAGHRSRPNLHRFLYGEAPRPPALQAKLKAFDDAVEQVLIDHFRDLGVPMAKARSAAALITRSGQALLHEFVLDDSLPGSHKTRLAQVLAALMKLAEETSKD